MSKTKNKVVDTTEEVVVNTVVEQHDTVEPVVEVTEEEKEPVVEQPVIKNEKKEEKVQKPTKTDSVFKVGAKVKLKETSKTITVNGRAIPKFAYRNTYKITKILPSRIIITAGFYTIAVEADQLESV